MVNTPKSPTFAVAAPSADKPRWRIPMLFGGLIFVVGLCVAFWAYSMFARGY